MFTFYCGFVLRSISFIFSTHLRTTIFNVFAGFEIDVLIFIKRTYGQTCRQADRQTHRMGRRTNGWPDERACLNRYTSWHWSIKYRCLIGALTSFSATLRIKIRRSVCRHCFVSMARSYKIPSPDLFNILLIFASNDLSRILSGRGRLFLILRSCCRITCGT